MKINQRGNCGICAGTGRVPKQNKRGGRKRTQDCIQCRGTGSTQEKYLTK